MNISAVIGLIAALGSVWLAGRAIGLNLGAMIQPSTACFILGGSLGAALIHFGWPAVRGAGASLRAVFMAPDAPALAERIQEIERLAHRARREGLAAAKSSLPFRAEPFFHRALELAGGGASARVAERTLQAEIDLERDRWASRSEVWEVAGRYAMALGGIAAALGIVGVLSNLDAPASMGPGFAAALFGILYGIGWSFLICRPVAGRLWRIGEQRARLQELTLSGVLLIVEEDEAGRRTGFFIAADDAGSPAAPAEPNWRALLAVNEDLRGGMQNMTQDMIHALQSLEHMARRFEKESANGRKRASGKSRKKKAIPA